MMHITRRQLRRIIGEEVSLARSDMRAHLTEQVYADPIDMISYSPGTMPEDQGVLAAQELRPFLQDLLDRIEKLEGSDTGRLDEAKNQDFLDAVDKSKRGGVAWYVEKKPNGNYMLHRLEKGKIEDTSEQPSNWQPSSRQAMLTYGWG